MKRPGKNCRFMEESYARKNGCFEELNAGLLEFAVYRRGRQALYLSWKFTTKTGKRGKGIAKFQKANAAALAVLFDFLFAADSCDRV